MGTGPYAGSRTACYWSRVLSVSMAAFCRLGLTTCKDWSSGTPRRGVVVDTGLAADLCGLGEQAFGPTADGTAAGALFETFVINEVFKQSTWSERSPWETACGRSPYRLMAFGQLGNCSLYRLRRGDPCSHQSMGSRSSVRRWMVWATSSTCDSAPTDQQNFHNSCAAR